jgi:large conductance mechanosensitive channel
MAEKKTAVTESQKNARASRAIKNAPKNRRGHKTVEVAMLKHIVPAPPAITIAAERRLGAEVGGFIAFLRQQGVVGLAVGIVIGGAVGTMVKSLISNLVMPPLGLLLGSSQGIAGLRWFIGRARDNHAATYLQYGAFLNDFIDFIVVALVIYLVIHLLRLDRLDKPKS